MHRSVSVLKKHPRFRALVLKHGMPDIGRGGNPFKALCRAIVYQQITGKAAATILGRVMKLLDGRLTPARVLALSKSAMRSAGLSAQKSAYLHDLARKFSDGTVQSRALARMSNEEIVAHLTQVKGIGVWSAQMFLIFTLGRLDVLPTLDLGIQKGFQRVYALKKLPTHVQMERLAREWREHASVASWYLWRAADEAKEK